MYRASARESLALRICESVTLLRSLVFGRPDKRGWYRLIHRMASGSPDLKALTRSLACFSYCCSFGRSGSSLSPFITKLLASPRDESSCPMAHHLGNVHPRGLHCS